MTVDSEEVDAYADDNDDYHNGDDYLDCIRHIYVIIIIIINGNYKPKIW